MVLVGITTRGNIMKTIKTCAPLFLILAIGCDDRNEAIELDETTTEARWKPAEEGMTVEQDDIAARAAHIVKAQRAVNQLLAEDVLYPFHQTEEFGDILPNCDIIKSEELVSRQSACPNMPGEGYEVEIVECTMDNGDTYSGTMLVSAEVIRDAPFLNPAPVVTAEALFNLLEPNRDWIVDVNLTSGTGTEISACGVASTSPRINSNNLTMSITNPLVDAGPGMFVNAIYESNTVQKNRGRSQVIRSEMTLAGAERPDSEIHHMRVRGLYRSGDLLPQHGHARYTQAEMGTLQFNGNAFSENTVAVESPFQGGSLLEVPAL